MRLTVVMCCLFALQAWGRTAEGPAFTKEFFAMDRCLKAAVEANNRRIEKLPKTLAGIERQFNYAGLGHLSVVEGTKLIVMSPDGQYELGKPGGGLSCKTAKGNSAASGLREILNKYGRMDADQKALMTKDCAGVVDFSSGTPQIILNPGAGNAGGGGAADSGVE